ncbi:hypothetical protein BCR36DRAFT_146410 [Piromyces finnis]|uniref:Uncharacterized protein n=1 Tax=Piromyces finnis TaxID=1754191 RepID=A0A1Y1UYH3_9FUNG|nr:hypothetical protein BCR36DRAFT_146410 [Piromyces finnis]|eukprot:ORX43309.1 hypothetical protein BCR36DRAFT_146410 [Piromyces finnis]
MCTSSSFNALNTNNTIISTTVQSELLTSPVPIINSNILNSTSILQQNTSTPLDSCIINNSSIAKHDSVILNNTEINSLDTITQKNIHNNVTLDNTLFNSNNITNQILNNPITNNTIIDNTININNTTSHNESSCAINATLCNQATTNNTILFYTSPNTSIIENNANTIDVNTATPQTNEQTQIPAVNNSCIISNNLYSNNLTIPILSKDHSLSLPSISQTTPKPININNSKHYYSLINLNETDIPPSLDSNDANRSSIVHFSSSFSQTNQIHSSKASLKKKHKSFSIISDLFNAKLISRTTPITAATNNESNCMNLFKTIVKKDKKKMDTVSFSSFFSEFKNSLKKNDNYSEKSDSSYKKKKKRKSYVKILLRNKNNDKNDINDVNHEIKNDDELEANTDSIITKSSDIKCKTNCQKEKSKKNKIKIKMGFNRTKISKNNKLKKLNNSIHHNSIHCSKPKFVNTSLSSSNSSNLPHLNLNNINSSFDYKENRNQEHVRHSIIKPDITQDDPYYSFSEDVLNSLSNIENYTTNNCSCNNSVSMILQQNSQVIPSRTSSNSIPFNTSSFLLSSFTSPNPDSQAIPQNKIQSNSYKSLKNPILNESSSENKNYIPTKDDKQYVDKDIQQFTKENSDLDERINNISIKPLESINNIEENKLNEYEFLMNTTTDPIIEQGTSEEFPFIENHNKGFSNTYQNNSNFLYETHLSDQLIQRQNSYEIRNQRLQELRRQRRHPLLTPLEKRENRSAISTDFIQISNKKEIGLINELLSKNISKEENIREQALTECPTMESSNNEHINTNNFSSLIFDDLDKRILYGREGHQDNSLHYHNSVDSHCQSIYEKYRKLSHYHFSSRLGSIEPSISRHSSMKFSPHHSNSRNQLVSLPSEKDVSISISTTSSSSLDSVYLINSNEHYLNHSSSLKTNSRNDYGLNRSASYRRVYPRSNYTSYENINYTLPIKQNKFKSYSQEVSPENNPDSILSNSTICSNTNSSSFERLACHDESYLFSSSSPQPPLLAHHASINYRNNKSLRYNPPVFRNQSVKEDNNPYRFTNVDYGCYYCQPPEEYDDDINVEEEIISESNLNPVLSFASENPSSYISIASSISHHKTNSQYDYEHSSMIIPEAKLTTSLIPPSPTSEKDNHKLSLNDQNIITTNSSIKEKLQKSIPNLNAATSISTVNHIGSPGIIENIPSCTTNVSIQNYQSNSESNSLENRVEKLKDLEKSENDFQKNNEEKIDSGNNDNVKEYDDKEHKNKKDDKEDIISAKRNNNKHDSINGNDNKEDTISAKGNSKKESKNKEISVNNEDNKDIESKNSKGNVREYNIQEDNNQENKLIILSENEQSSNKEVNNVLESKYDDKDSNLNNIIAITGLQSISKSNTILRSKSISNLYSNSSLKVKPESITRSKSISSLNSSSYRSKRYSKTSHSIFSSNYVHSPLIVECIPTTEQKENETKSCLKERNKFVSLDENTLLNRKKIEKRAKHQSDQIYSEVPLLKRLSFISLSKLPLKSTSYMNTEQLECSPLLTYTLFPRNNSQTKFIDPIFGKHQSINATSIFSYQYQCPFIPPAESYRFEDTLKCLLRYNDQSISDPYHHEKIANSLDAQEFSMYNDKMPSSDILRELLKSYCKESHLNNHFSLTNLIQMKEIEMPSKKSLFSDHVSDYYLNDDNVNEESIYPSITYPLTSWEKRKALMILSLYLRDITLQHDDHYIYERKKDRGMVVDASTSNDIHHNCFQFTPTLLSSDEIQKNWGDKKENRTGHSISVKRLSNLSKRSFPSFLKNGECRTILTNPSGRIASVQTLFDENNDSKAQEQLPSVNTTNNNECYNINVTTSNTQPNINTQIHHITSVKTLCNSNQSNHTSPLMMNLKNEFCVMNDDKNSNYVTSNENVSSLSFENISKITTPELESSPDIINGEKIIEIDQCSSRICLNDPSIKPENKIKYNITKNNSVFDDASSELHLFEKLSNPSSHTDSNDKVSLDLLSFQSSSLINKGNMSASDQPSVFSGAIISEQNESESMIPSELSSKSISYQQKSVERSETTTPVHSTITNNDRTMDHFSTLTTTTITKDEIEKGCSSITESIQNSLLEYNEMSSPSLSTINSFNTNDTSFEFSHQTSYLSINVGNKYEICKAPAVRDNDTDLSYILNNDSSSMDTNPKNYAFKKQVKDHIPTHFNNDKLMKFQNETYSIASNDISGDTSRHSNLISESALTTNTLNSKLNKSLNSSISNKSIGKDKASSSFKHKAKNSKCYLKFLKLCSFKRRRDRKKDKKKKTNSLLNQSLTIKSKPLDQKIVTAETPATDSSGLTSSVNPVGSSQTVDIATTVALVNMKKKKAAIMNNHNLSTSAHVKSNRLIKKISLRSLKSMNKDHEDSFYRCHINQNTSTSNLNQYIKSKFKPFDHIILNKRKTFIEKDVNNSSIVIHEKSGTPIYYTENGFLSSIKNGKSLSFKDDEDDDYVEEDEKYKNNYPILKDIDSLISGSEFNSSSKGYSSPFENSLSKSKIVVSSHSQSQLKIVMHMDNKEQNNVPKTIMMDINKSHAIDMKELQERLQVIAQTQKQKEQKEQENISELSDDQIKSNLSVTTDSLIKSSSTLEDTEPTTEKSNIGFYNPDLSVFRYPPISPNINDKSSVVSSISDLDEIIYSIQSSFVKSICESDVVVHNSKEILNIYEQNKAMLKNNSLIDQEVEKLYESDQNDSTDSRINTTLEFKQVTTNSNEYVIESTSEIKSKEEKTIEKIKENRKNDNEAIMENTLAFPMSEINESHLVLKVPFKEPDTDNVEKEEKTKLTDEMNHKTIETNLEKDKSDQSISLISSNNNESTSVKAIASETYLNGSHDEDSKILDKNQLKYIYDITKDTQKYIIPNQNTSHHLHHITDKIIKKFKSELSIKKKSFISLKSKVNLSNSVKSPTLSNTSYSTSPSSIRNSINNLNIDHIKSPSLSSKSYGTFLEYPQNRKSRISLNHGNPIKEQLRLKSSRKSIILPSKKSNSNFNFACSSTTLSHSFCNKNKNNESEEMTIYNNYTLDKMIPYLLTSNSDNMNIIINSINNHSHKLDDHPIHETSNVKSHKKFSDILIQLEHKNCKSSGENCSHFVKESISDFNSKLNDFHWTYKSEKFHNYLLNRIRSKEEEDDDKLNKKDKNDKV